MTPELTLAGPDLRRIADVVLADLLPPRLRRLWLSRMGRMAIAQAKKNVREQKTVDGSPMAPRKRKPPKIRPVYHRDGSVTQKKTHDKMLVDLVKSRWLGMDLPDEDTARVKFFKGAGIVAFRHQYGISEKVVRKAVGDLFSKEEMTPGTPESYNKVNRTVAIELIKCGVKQSVMEIQRTWTVFQASVYLAKIKTGWTIQVPARPFLGLDEEQKIAMGDAIMAGIYNRFKAKNHENLLK